MKRLLFILVLISGPAQAYDEACAGCLCLPMGFGHPSCQPAKIEMFKRMLEFKSPLPSFGSCSTGGNPTRIEYATGIAAYVPGPDPIRLGVFCNFRDDGPEQPRGCVATLQTIQITEGGLPLGDKYIRYKDGPDWTMNNETGVFTRLIDQL